MTMVKIKELTTYETPQVEVIEVEVEKGFAASEGYTGGGTTETPSV